MTLLHGSAFLASSSSSSPESHNLFTAFFSSSNKHTSTTTLTHLTYSVVSTISVITHYHHHRRKMGRDWYQKSGAKTSSTSSKSSSSSSFSPSGCFNAVFHLFDFHHFQFPLNHQTTSSSTAATSSSCSCFKPEPDSFISPNTTVMKGAEAPRNSLESEDEVSTSTSASASVSLTSTSKEDEILNIPIGIQIKTRRSKDGAPNNETCSEISSSPGTKTPTLVARLMGLDLLPESPSPSLSSTPNFQQSLKPLQTRIISHRKPLDGDMRGRTGTRSLPETPRISSARRSDVDIHHHRLSLQINKENMSPSEELVISRLKALKRKEVMKHEDHENKSPGHYARMIVKQVKESVGRKLGTDITNTVQIRDEIVRKFKSNKNSRALTKLADNNSSTVPSCSPKLSKPVIDSSTKVHNTQPPKSSSFSSSPEIKIQPKLQPVKKEQHEHHHKQQLPKAASKCKKEETFVRPSTDKKSKRTPLSNDLLNISVPTLLPVKKDHSLPPTKIPQKQVLDAQKPKRRSTQLSSCSSQMYYNKQQSTTVHFDRDYKNDDRSMTGDAEAEYEYIDRILRRIGLNKTTTPLCSISWFSPSHPIDPSIFYYLEHFTTCSTQLRHRCNRKLLFHLVDEILIEILKPYFNMKPCVVFVRAGHDFSRLNGTELIDMLCSKIRRFPRADCRVLEDIDGLIEQDLQMKDQIVMAYEEEGEGIVTEIEKDIIEALMHETASDFCVRV